MKQFSKPLSFLSLCLVLTVAAPAGAEEGVTCGPGPVPRDSDNDGTLNRNEIDVDKERMLDWLDHNGDGYISRAEYIACFPDAADGDIPVIEAPERWENGVTGGSDSAPQPPGSDDPEPAN